MGDTAERTPTGEERFTHEEVCESALSLFLSLGWIERSEKITYVDEGVWEVDATVYVNFERLIGEGSRSEFQPLFKDGPVLFLPVVELPKYSGTRFLEAYRSNGDRVYIAPDEVSHVFELLIIMGCIVRAMDKGYLEAGSSDGDSNWRPSRKLIDLILGEFRDRSVLLQCGYGNYKGFLAGFYEKLRGAGADGNSNPYEEYKRLAYHCPGFELLFVHFVYNQICLLQIDRESVNSKSGEVFSFKFTEYHDQFTELHGRKSRLGRLWHTFKTLFREAINGREFTYPLGRIGTSETENFAIYAPDWTMFQPLILGSIYERWKKKSLKLYWWIKVEPYHQIGSECNEDGSSNPSERPEKRFDITKELYYQIVGERNEDGSSNPSEDGSSNPSEDGSSNPSERPEKRFDIDVVCREEVVFLRTFATWDKRLKQTYRRFRVFEEIEQSEEEQSSTESKGCKKTPAGGWGAHSLNSVRLPTLHIGWGPKSGRRVRANLAFLFVSFLSVCFVTVYVHGMFGCIVANYWNKPTLFSTLPIAVTLLMLAYSNLQERVSYYRDALMRLPKYLVRVGVICDAGALFFGLTSVYCGSVALICMIVLNVFILLAFLLMLLWWAFRGERLSLNRLDF